MVIWEYVPVVIFIVLFIMISYGVIYNFIRTMRRLRSNTTSEVIFPPDVVTLQWGTYIRQDIAQEALDKANAEIQRLNELIDKQ